MKGGRKTIGLKLGIMLLCMVTIPTLSLGLLTYFTFKNETNTSAATELAVIAHDWKVITETYIQQEERVLRREETLVETRLKSISLHVKALIEAEEDESGTVSEHVIELIDSIELGRNGYVFLLDYAGNFVQTNTQTNQSKKFSKVTNNEGEDITAEILKKSHELRNGQTYTAQFVWYEEGSNEPRKQLAVFSYSEKLDIIVGALSFYSDFQSSDLRWILQDELRTLMSEQTIKDNGYVWALNSQGDYLVSKEKLRDGENIYSTQDSKGQYIIQDLIASVTALEADGIYTTQFAWKNLGEISAKEQLTAATYVPEWDWIIAVSANEDDYLKGLTRIQWYIFFVSIFAILAGSLASYIFSQYITRPLKSLQKAALEMRDGNLDHPITNSSHDEVGLLADDLEVMRQQLKSRNQNLEQTNTALKELSLDLTTKNESVEKLNKFMIDRELKMIELKKEIVDLKKKNFPNS